MLEKKTKKTFLEQMFFIITIIIVITAIFYSILPMAILQGDYIYQIQKTILTFKDASGIWYADRYRPYVFMITNLVSNIVLVNFIGIYGIVLSTILAFLISLPWINWTLFSQLFHKSSSINLILILKNSILTVILGMTTFLLCKPCGNSIAGIIGRSIICILIPNAILISIYHKSPYLKYWYNFIFNKMFKFI